MESDPIFKKSHPFRKNLIAMRLRSFLLATHHWWKQGIHESFIDMFGGILEMQHLIFSDPRNLMESPKQSISMHHGIMCFSTCWDKWLTQEESEWNWKHLETIQNQWSPQQVVSKLHALRSWLYLVCSPYTLEKLTAGTLKMQVDGSVFEAKLR